MTQKTLLSLFAILVLTGAVVGSFAAEPAALSEEPTSLEAQAVTPEPELLIDEAPQMSIDRERTRTADADLLRPDTDWWQGICWTSCWPCNSDSDCPWGGTCVFGVQCP